MPRRARQIPVDEESEGFYVNPEKSGVTVEASYVNIRTKPSGVSAVLETVPIGTPVTIVGSTDKQFVEVRYQGETGYIDRRYVKAK